MNSENQKYDNTEIVSDSKVLSKLENFWYHNKWTVIVVAFFACVILVCTVQMFGKDRYDATVLCGTTEYLSSDERAALIGTVEQLLPKDYDKSGDKAIAMIDYQIFSEKELYEEIETEIDGVMTTVKVEKVAAHWNADQYNGMRDAIKTGEYSLCFASPYVYEQLLAGYVAEGKTVRLGDTDFYRYNEAVQVLPADTVVCLLRQFAIGESSKDDVYARSEALFDAIVAYDVKE